MPLHPDSPYKRKIDFGEGDVRERPVDALGRNRQFLRVEEGAVQTRADGTIGFKGHAAMFNSRTLIGSKRWGFYEEIAPGAFRKTIKEADVRFLKNHDPNYVLARNKAGTLRLSEDDGGLAVDADMGAYSYARDVAEALRSGDMNQMSFAFDVIAFERSIAEDDIPVYRLTEVRLWDVAVVTYPAYEDTDAALRSKFERLVRDGLGQDPSEVLRRMEDDSFDLSTLRTGQPPARTGDPAAPPPAETTGALNRHEQLRRHRMRELQTLMKEQ